MLTCTACEPRAALVLGHGAGGGVSAPDLVAVDRRRERRRASRSRWSSSPTASPAAARPRLRAQLDAAWTAVIEQLAARELKGLPLVTGGRSSGARVACRTAAATGAIGVLCLAFPLQPPRRTARPRRAGSASSTRYGAGAGVQGASDPFGMPPPGRGRKVVEVRGHAQPAAPTSAGPSGRRAWLAKLTAP